MASKSNEKVRVKVGIPALKSDGKINRYTSNE